MDTINIDHEVESIHNRFKSTGIDIDKNRIRDGLTKLTGFHVPLNEAVKTVTRSLRKEYNVSSDNQKDAALVPIGTVTEDNIWITVRGKVVKLWEPTSEAISQTGLIGDESGIVKFTIFTKSQGKLGINLQEGKSYELRNVVSSLWRNQMSLKINSNSEIVPLQENIEAAKQCITMTGIIISVSSGSGLIKRCPECNRRIIKGTCREHGNVEGIYDLRLKAHFQDSVPSTPAKTYELILNANLVEKIAGINLQKAKEMALEQFDMDVVTSALSDKVLFKHFIVKGTQMPVDFLVEDIKPATGISITDMAKEVKRLIAPFTGGN